MGLGGSHDAAGWVQRGTGGVALSYQPTFPGTKTRLWGSWLWGWLMLCADRSGLCWTYTATSVSLSLSALTTSFDGLSRAR